MAAVRQPGKCRKRMTSAALIEEQHVAFAVELADVARTASADAVAIALDSRVTSLGPVHTLDPDGTSLLAVTEDCEGAVVSASYFPRWHTHPVT